MARWPTPRIRVGGNVSAGASAPFQIQGTSDHVRLSATNTHAEVPGTFMAGGNITAPSFIGNANTATKLKKPRMMNGVVDDGLTNITITANPTSTAIPANSDLNDYVTQGEYRVASISTASTILNVPSARAFNLTVQINNANLVGVTQTFKTYDINTSHQQWVRSLKNNN